MKTTPKRLPESVAPSDAEVTSAMLRSETLSLRLTKDEKASMIAAKAAAGLTLTEYIVSCHRLVAPKLIAHTKARRM